MSADALAPYCRVVGRFDLDGEGYALLRTGPVRLDRSQFGLLTDALKIEGKGSWWRELKVWIVPEEALPRLAGAIADAFPVARAA